MIVASALGDLGFGRRRPMPNGRGETQLQRRARFAAARLKARAAMSPAQRAAQDAAVAASKAKAGIVARFKTELWKGQPGTRNYAVTPLSAEGKELQAATLARDWDRLFGLTGGVSAWVPKRGQHAPSLGKYSFQVVNGRRKYIPFTEADIASFYFSRHMRIQPGWTCSDQQKQMGVNAHWEKTRGHMAKYRDTSNPLHIWPILPGWGYPGQTFMCQKEKKSLWVKIRKKIYVAAAIVAAVYLGPAVYNKVGGMLAHGEAGGAIVGAGAKAGAATAVTTKAGAAAIVAAKAGTAAKAAGFFATVQKGIGVVNNARTVNAIIHGDMPPPPIATGDNFTEWAMQVAKDQLAKEHAEKLTELEERRMRAELEAIQREIDAFVPRGTPVAPDPNLQPGVRDRIIEMQNIERGRDNTGAIALAVAVPVALLALAG